ncbi:unnamed protein product [Sympodiomycopsis kandeliae]
MATAKIATLLIRTLAKPIATQLKTQAASHESFRKVCIGIAQTMHRSEMALRYNLLPKAPPRPVPPKDTESQNEDGEKEKEKEKEPQSHKPKVRPLNEAKAIANGANFLSEAFLFSIAAGLVILEAWRSSKKETKRRAKTRDGIEKLEDALKKLCALQNVDPKSIGISDEVPASSEEHEEEHETEEQNEAQSAATQQRLQRLKDQEEQTQRLQKAVDLLLRMAIQNGSIMGKEALDLQGTLDGKHNTPPSQTSVQDDAAPSPILSEIAKVRAKELAQMSRQ